MNVLAIGASKNIGYHTSLRLLGANCTVTFMLRSPSAFDSDETIQSYVRAGKAHLVKGDALVESDVQHAWEAASTHGPVDLLLFSVGATQASLHPLKGVVINPANLVTQSLFNVLCTMPQSQSPPPKLITISSNGLTHVSHATLPFLLKPLYGYLLALPHKDKLGAERVIAHCAGWAWDVKNDGEPEDDIMGPQWKERNRLPAPGSLSDVLVVRPALLTDGECKADTASGNGGYRVQEGDVSSAWTVSRKDVAHFVADAALKRWDEFKGKRVSIAY